MGAGYRYRVGQDGADVQPCGAGVRIGLRVNRGENSVRRQGIPVRMGEVGCGGSAGRLSTGSALGLEDCEARGGAGPKRRWHAPHLSCCVLPLAAVGDTCVGNLAGRLEPQGAYLFSA